MASARFTGCGGSQSGSWPLSTETGAKAEAVAAQWLERHGFRIIVRNWRTRWCEIDIVASRGDIIHIVEVKYRRRPDFGSGFEAITSDKIRRLRRAAAMWLENHHRIGSQYQIDIMAISGFPEPKDVDYLPNAIDGN